MALTGRFWFRKSWTGRLVLLVEEDRPRWFGGAGRPRWRNAKLLDFAEPELRPLMLVEQSQRAGVAPDRARPLRPIPAAGAAAVPIRVASA